MEAPTAPQLLIRYGTFAQEPNYVIGTLKEENRYSLIEGYWSLWDSLGYLHSTPDPLQSPYLLR